MSRRMNYARSFSQRGVAVDSDTLSFIGSEVENADKKMIFTASPLLQVGYIEGTVPEQYSTAIGDIKEWVVEYNKLEKSVSELDPLQKQAKEIYEQEKNLKKAWDKYGSYIASGLPLPLKPNEAVYYLNLLKRIGDDNNYLGKLQLIGEAPKDVVETAGYRNITLALNNINGLIGPKRKAVVESEDALIKIYKRFPQLSKNIISLYKINAGGKYKGSIGK